MIGATPVEYMLARVDRVWRRMRVLAEDRAALREDLRMELVAAAADGVPPDVLIGPDVAGFARALATSAGARIVRLELRRLLLTALAGALPGVTLAWFLIARWWQFAPEMGQLTRFTTCAAVFVAGILAAIRWGMRRDPALDRTVTAMAVAVPVAGLLVIPVTMGVASMADYSTAPPVLTIEAALVTAALATGAVSARHWALAPMLDAHR